MKRRLTQAEIDTIKAEYDKWDKFGAESETAAELAARLGISKATLYRLRERYWRADGRRPHNDVAALDVPAVPSSDLHEVIRWLTGELVAARAEIAELKRELGRDA